MFNSICNKIIIIFYFLPNNFNIFTVYLTLSTVFCSITSKAAFIGYIILNRLTLTTYSKCSNPYFLFKADIFTSLLSPVTFSKYDSLFSPTFTKYFTFNYVCHEFIVSDWNRWPMNLILLTLA